jgi:hypothetical protein
MSNITSIKSENKIFWNSMFHKIFPEFVHLDIINKVPFLYSHTCLKNYNNWGYNEQQQIVKFDDLNSIVYKINDTYKNFTLDGKIDGQIGGRNGYE